MKLNILYFLISPFKNYQKHVETKYKSLILGKTVVKIKYVILMHK